MLAKSISGAAAAASPAYIEDVFSTYLYTGTGATQTITNGIDLSGKGGLVWLKDRTSANSHWLTDTVRGVNSLLRTNGTDAAANVSTYLTSFNNNGFSISTAAQINTSSNSYASWTFREQAKFFDVVTYTGNGSNRTIAHNLGSVPGCIIVKRTDTAADWQVYHRSLANTEYIVLNSTAAKATGTTRWNSTTPTSTVFSLGTDTTVNANGGTYVAYLFAHDAGGFGLTGTDNVISCGSYTDNGTDQVINLGYEPQWILLKDSAGAANWFLIDIMRGWLGQPISSNASVLFPNTSQEEITPGGFINVTPTGFQIKSGSGLGNSTFIYIAIRRGPMKVPTSGTSVYNAIARTGTGAAATVTGVGFAPDWYACTRRDDIGDRHFTSRLTGTAYLRSNSIATETSNTDEFAGFLQDGVSLGLFATFNGASRTFINHFFRRAPGFFDVVCWTGTGGSPNISHNLGAVPQLLIQKIRGTSGGWYTQAYVNGINSYGQLQTTSSFTSLGSSNIPTSTTFVPIDNSSGFGFVAYLFASVAGVSKVGSYTGTGTTKQIDCGFTGGARFVLIKRTDSTGDWYVWDSARGIVAGNDPYLLLNSTAAEVTNTDYVDTYSAGFEISSTAPAAIDANGGTFIFLAIA